MLPSEHGLSQRVLEFLIAHQDWFMLDIPPPPMRKQSVPRDTSTTGIDGDPILVQSSDEEIQDGWKLVGRDPPNVLRRNTAVDRSGKSNIDFSPMFKEHTILYCSDNRGTLTEEDMSPVQESSSEQAGVTRRRTLPSSRRRGDVSEGPFSQGSRVLRKQKRASSSQPSRIGKPETPPS
jgi:hypothetical protein